MKKILFILVCFGTLILSCSTSSNSNPFVNQEEAIDTELPEDDLEDDETDNENELPRHFKILSLGDSYTIGQSVCETCRFPEQLKARLLNHFSNSTINLQVIAQTGWTTTDLKAAINNQDPTNDQDLVTLLIGVNNQYQNKPFSIYQTEFTQLVNTAIDLAKGDASNVIVISIPDYAFTPFGNGNTSISQEIDNYNTYAENYCFLNSITYVYITDITREGLTNPNLVAPDNLHPSELAYTRFVERILPKAIEKLE